MNPFVLYFLTASALIASVSLFRIAIAFGEFVQAHVDDTYEGDDE